MRSTRRRGTRAVVGVVMGMLMAAFGRTASAQPAARIAGQIQTASRTLIEGSQPPRARADMDAGSVAGDMKLEGMTLVFSRTPAQQIALETLIAAQQNPASPLYHQWMTPDEVAASFGMAGADLAKVENWLQSQGFTVDGVSRSRDRITFSGSEAQVESAFGTSLHYYKGAGQSYYAPSSDISVPAALSGAVQTVTNLSSFRARPHMVVKSPVAAKPNFTSSQSGNHYLTPKDVATIYDVNAAYSAGYTGTGQTIAVVGQSFVNLTDVSNFQTAAGVTANAPSLVLVPSSGTAAFSTGDQGESDLDLEYTSAIAKGASIFFVYTGNNTNYGVFDALTYAVTNRLAPIISVSYGLCETGLGSANYTALNQVLSQAALQGQSVISASGDSGSTDCNGETGLTTAQQQALAVDFPGSSQYVTSLGGTEFATASVATTNTTYWTAASGADVIGSALSYIPEVVWNDDSTTKLSSTGGGTSVLTTRPSWQTGVAGIPAGTFRTVPDVSLDASPNNAGYLYCSSDSTSTGVTGSCSNGFRDSSNATLTVAGGTSFAAPIFSGMLALINQSRNSTGQGVVASTLYTLASNATTYASAFHDVTSGSNACLVTTGLCSTAGSSAYSAGVGYDQATGLGSVDLFNLLTAWPKTTVSTLASSVTTLAAASPSPASGAADVITIAVGSGTTLTTTPTGTISLTVDGAVVNSSLALASGKATYSFSSTTAGAHVIVANYSGDGVYAASTGTVTVTVAAVVPTSTFTLASTAVTIAQGGSGISTITVTPTSGYTGTVGWTITTSPSLTNACYTLANTIVPGSAAVTAKLTLYTSSVTCANGAAAVGASGLHRISAGAAPVVPGTRPVPLGIAMAGLLLTGLLGRRSKRVRGLVAMSVIVLIGFGVSGCSGASAPTTSPTTADSVKGTYTVTVTGTDTVSPTVTASTAFTLTVN